MARGVWSPSIALAALLGIAAEGNRALKGQSRVLLIVALGLAAAVLARLAVLAMIDVTSFRAIHARHLSAVHPLFVVFSVVGACGLLPRGAHRS